MGDAGRQVASRARQTLRGLPTQWIACVAFGVGTEPWGPIRLALLGE